MLLAATLGCSRGTGPTMAPAPDAPTVNLLLQDGRLVAEGSAVRFPDGAYSLDFDDYESMSLLLAVRDTMVANPSLQLVVEGHTDSRGDADFNRNLSEMRAHEIVGWLVSEGVDASRLEAIGYGEDEPAYDESDCTHVDGKPTPDEDLCADVWRVNRRVVFTVVAGPKRLKR
jgi:outer membrane protein OmpA-like peptidoglycan-associated protein